jgi:hypothetical protein
MSVKEYIETMLIQECEAMVRICKSEDKPYDKADIMRFVMGRMNSLYNDYLKNFSIKK